VLLAAGCLALPGAAQAATPTLVATADAYVTADGRMLISCAAQSADPALASNVGISECSASNGGWAPTISLPGTTAATANFLSVSPGPFELCVRASASLTIGGRGPDTGRTCSPSILGAAHVEATAAPPY
jgi:hypothetical protein